jgi:predicted dithiol-disulfide oxidoreductase (DUF899 family)
MSGPTAVASATSHDKRFPNESAAYRHARDELLRAEAALRRQMEEVAALRRRLPPGGEVTQDYQFAEGPTDLSQDSPVRTVRLSELFTRGDTLVIYSFMYGPSAAQPCPMCTSMLDGLNGNAPHILQRADLVVVAKSPIERVRAFARERGWRNLRLLSSYENSYNRDYFGEGADGAQWPALNVFVRRDGKVSHFYCTELLFAPSEPGQNGRHVDLLWPLWNVLDLTPEGRGSDWYPKLRYGSS